MSARWVALRPVGRCEAMYVTRTAARLGEHVEVGGGYAVVEPLDTAGLTQRQAAKAAVECEAQGVAGPRYSLHLPPFCQ